MASAVEDLEKRLNTLEQEVAALRQMLECWAKDETPAQRGARLLREAKANQGVISAAVARAYAELGITGQPIGAENVQKMVAACGFKPEDNEFSRGIVAMREE